MRGVLVLAAVLALARHVVADREHFTLSATDFQRDPRGAFYLWTRHYDKTYIGRATEYEQRLVYWTDNVADLIGRSNAPTPDVNGLMDLHDNEIAQTLLGHRRAAPRLEHKKSTGKAHLEYRYRFVEPAESVDWRPTGIVGPIKNQHVNGSKCGCCWSFATVATVESINALATGKMDVLSEQQLIACDQAAPYYDLGCKGGDFEGGMKYIIDHGGISLEEDYPYLAEDSKCDHKKAARRVVTIDAVEDVPGGNETALMQAVTMHPTAIGLCVGPWIKEWRAYTGGILRVPENCEEPQDHAMPVVGYGREASDSEEFWILKNSWGADWGEAGFLRLPKGMPGNGSLGLAANPGYPVKIGDNPRSGSGSGGGPSLLASLLPAWLGRRDLQHALE